MATNRAASASASGAAVPTGADTVIATVTPGPIAGNVPGVLVRADCLLIGAASVTGVTVKIHRGTTTAGATLYNRLVTVAAAVNVAAVATFNDNAYDGTGYNVSMQAAGAAATADATIEAQPLAGVF